MVPNTGEERIVQALLELAASGCQGNLHDFRVWLKSEYQIESTDEELSSLLKRLVEEKQFTKHPTIPSEYVHANPPPFADRISYEVPSSLDYSPIQWVRSRLESFLKHHRVSNNEVIDLSIAITEAMENAVKYSTDKKIKISYEIADTAFSISIENEIKDISPEVDIESGKYTGSLTLMRGMMVMVKLLDKVDIDIDERENKAIFRAEHKLRRG